MEIKPEKPSSAAPAPPAKPSGISDPVYVTAMSHFYRGELGRAMIWRPRLDATTTWAITPTSTIFTVAFSFKDVPHIIFVFNIAIVAILLWIEARRYRFYDAFRARVRMLEAHFLVPIVMRNEQILQGDWRRLISEDLILPAFKISTFEAVGRRLKRNYVFLFIIIQVAWLTKIFLHAPHTVDSLWTFYQALGVGQIRSWFVAAFFLLILVANVGVTVYIARNTSGEFSEFGTN